jgi:hypothetical protein
MGQKLSSLRFSCVDCSSSLATQEDFLNESSVLKFRLARESPAVCSPDEIEEFPVLDHPIFVNESSYTQASLPNFTNSKDSDHAFSSSTTGLNPALNRHLRTETLKTKPSPNSHTHYEIESMCSSNSSINGTLFTHTLKYKLRSNHLSVSSYNLVESVRGNKLI